MSEGLKLEPGEWIVRNVADGQECVASLWRSNEPDCRFGEWTAFFHPHANRVGFHRFFNEVGGENSGWTLVRRVLPQPDAEPLTEGELQAWSELAAKATPGPWATFRSRSRSVSGIDSTASKGRIAKLNVGNKNHDEVCANGEYIAAACNALPRLVAEVRRLRSEGVR